MNVQKRVKVLSRQQAGFNTGDIKIHSSNNIEVVCAVTRIGTVCRQWAADCVALPLNLHYQEASNSYRPQMPVD